VREIIYSFKFDKLVQFITNLKEICEGIFEDFKGDAIPQRNFCLSANSKGLIYLESLFESDEKFFATLLKK